MAKTIEEYKQALGFEQNEVFDAVLAYLNASIEAEVDRAISHSIEGEKRIHGCGRAEALRDFKELILSEQLEANKSRVGS